MLHLRHLLDKEVGLGAFKPQGQLGVMFKQRKGQDWKGSKLRRGGGWEAEPTQGGEKSLKAMEGQ